MIHNRKRFHIGFNSVPTPVSDVWHTLVSCLQAENCLPDWFYVSQIAGHAERFHSEERLKLTVSEISDLIDRRNLDAFAVNTGYSASSVAFDLRHMKNFGTQSVLECRLETRTKAPADWTRLIEAVMIQWPCIGGWQWNNLYQVWQWTCSYELPYQRLYGERPPGLKTFIRKSNDGIVPDREMIDISLNPGRRRDIVWGVYFLPAAEMWLGPHFWQYAKCTREEAMAADFFLEVRDTPHFLYLKSWPEPFSRPDGEQGRVQQKLWKMFFQEDCEWPPGSGGISDEAIYGPPELMPPSKH